MDVFCQKLEHIFDHFLNTYENLIRSQCLSRLEDIFKPTIGNESIHKISYDIEARVVNCATSQNLAVTSTMFPYDNQMSLMHRLICNTTLKLKTFFKKVLCYVLVYMAIIIC
jgi:hypothetical protein